MTSRQNKARSKKKTTANAVVFCCPAASAAMPPPQAVRRRTTVTRASRSKARLLDEPNRRGSWRSHVHRTYTAQRVQLFKPKTGNGNLSLGGFKGGYSLLKESIPLFTFIRAVPSALLFPIHAQREKPPLICKDKKTTPRCCEFLRSSSPLRRASRAPHRHDHR